MNNPRQWLALLSLIFIKACGGGGDAQNLATVVDIVRPVISSANSFTVSENQTSIGSAVASISDYSTLSYSLSGADADAISINSSTGVMSFNSAPDYETKNSYAVKLNVAAGSVLTSQDITISISNTQEPISWVEASPESVGMDSGKLSDAFDKIFADGYWTQAALVIKDNKLIYERYRGLKSSEAEALENSPTRDKTYTVQERWGLRDINSVVTSWSTAKSITSVLIAIAIEQGFISSIDQSASDFIVEWANDSRNQITIRNLLDMQSGLHKVCWVNDGLAPCTRNGNDADIMYVDNQLQPCINREMAITGVTYPWHDSGATIFELGNYEYNNCDTMVLGEILFRATGKNIETAVKEACEVRFRPIIMTSLSTMIAMLPLVIGNIGPGAGEGSRLAVGYTILGGMIISTFFTLYVTPSMYLSLAKNTKRIDAVDLELKKELIKK